MLYLAKTKFEALLKSRGLNIAKLAKQCGVSRQSIYNMLGGETVFNTTFDKMLSFLTVSYKDLTEEMDEATVILRSFPDKIKKIALSLENFCAKNSADLILFGSRAAGKKGVRHDFDFAVYFHKKTNDEGLKKIKRSLTDKAFPYRVDIVDLNSAPEWFTSSIKDDIVYLRKQCRYPTPFS